MTCEEADKIASVLAQVDGGCRVCAGVAAADMARHFPDFDWYELVEEHRRPPSDLEPTR